MDFVELAYKRLEERWIKPHDYIAWAEQLLTEGCDAPSIAELASCSWDAEPDAQQVERIFQACILELELTLPGDWYAALLAYASSICQKMLDGAMQPWDCVREMLTLADDNDAPYMLWIWIDLMRNFPGAHTIGLADILYNGALELHDSEECIRRTARQFIALCSMPLPEKFPLVWYCLGCEAISNEDTFTEAETCTCINCSSMSSMKNMRFFEHRDAFVERNGP